MANTAPVNRIAQNPSRWPEENLVRRSPAINAPAGKIGKIYPGSFEPEKEKNARGISIQARANTRKRSTESAERARHPRAFTSPSIRNAVQGKDNGIRISR